MLQPGPSDRAEGGATFGVPITPATVALALTAAFAVVMATIWVRAAVQMAGHGFDVTDEGYYLLSYRWWNVNHRSFTGTQFLYGPVFQLLDYDIARLRLFRFFTVVGTHLLFGGAFMQWLRLRRPLATKSPLWEIAGTAAIVATSGTAVAWLPLSPGYNDVSLLGAVLATAFVLRLATHVERGTPIPRWLPAALGPLIVSMSLAKWASSVATLGPILVVAAIVVYARGAREVARVFAWTIAGAVGFLVLLNLFIVRLDKFLPEMLAVNRLLVGKTNSPSVLLQLYWDSSRDLLKNTVDRHELLLVAAIVAVVSRGREAQIVAGLLAIVGLHRSVTRVQAEGGLEGGTVNLGRYAITIHAVALAALAMAVTALIVSRFSRSRPPSLCRETRRGWLIFGLLIVLPVTHGFGTGNWLYVLIVNCFAAWMAIIIAIATGLDTSPRIARWFAFLIAAGGVVASVLITKSGLTEHPYRTDAYAKTRTVVTGAPALRSVRLRADIAMGYAGLRRAVEPYVDPKGRAMMGFDELSGILLMFDGRPIGEAWSSTSDPPRTAAGLRAACQDGKPWWGTRLPLLIFRRPVTQVETSALKDCGIDFATEYRVLDLGGQTMGLTIYVPTREAVGASRE